MLNSRKSDRKGSTTFLSSCDCLHMNSYSCTAGVYNVKLIPVLCNYGSLLKLPRSRINSENGMYWSVSREQHWVRG